MPESEIWKDVVGYEGMYQVSNYGRVKNANGHVMKQRIVRGYWCVGLTDSSHKQRGFGVHRLVAMAFIPKPDDGTCYEVGHIDESRTNNRVDNLAWVTRVENNNTPLHRSRLSVNNARTGGNFTRSAFEVSPSGELVRYWHCILDVERESGINDSMVNRSLKDGRPHGGYKYEYYSSSKEYWKDIEGYEGIYQVSTQGRVRNVSSSTHTLLSLGLANRYRNVVLCNDLGHKTFLVHRLVAKAFLGNCPEGCEVNHIDEDGLNNEVINLAYASHIVNSNMPMRKIRLSEAQKGKPRTWLHGGKNGMARAVAQCTRYGVRIKEFECIRDAERYTGIKVTSISNCLAGRSKTAGGYGWEYV